MLREFLALGCALIAIVLTGCYGPNDPLNTAAARGDVDQIRILVKNGSVVNGQGPHGITALVSAARAGSIAAIPVLVGLGADPDLRCGVNGWTPVMHAIHKHQVASVRALLDAGADVNGRGDGGQNALMMASGYGYTDIVNVLLDHGADTRAKTPGGMNALSLAVSGTNDIDRFTMGDCQLSTVRALVEKEPGLKIETSSAIDRTLVLSKLKGCAALNEIVK